ncbi:MAG: protein translocase subunit SecD [Candidatus Taylorbacteria bacterium]|nr:protein translocase subunit SecD [Candidatus Taylorbacteria bacterium]
MWKKRLAAIILILASVLVGFYADVRFEKKTTFPYATVSVATKNYKLGLDLNGGTHLIYQAETSKLSGADVADSMTALRDVIERRVNMFGVSEPLVQVEKGGIAGGGADRLIVELPGVTDIDQAIKLIGQTPVLEFKLVDEAVSKEMNALQGKSSTVDAETTKKLEDLQKKLFIDTGLTGRFLSKANLDFDQRMGEPKVVLTFNSEGQKLFSKITKENINKILAIFLDGSPISTPVIREEITSGDAVISGGFRVDEAKQLARNLNYGALPVEIKLINTQTIGASLGENALNAGLRSGIIAYLIIALFLILWYRLPGFLASIALLFYVSLNLLIFKFLVTLTAAGIAGFILSIGMAVDANILIFERMKEELARGRTLEDSIKEGFARAWTSIRDSNLSSIITAIILYWFASTSLIKGFAFVFFIGVVTSMFTAIVASRTLLMALGAKGQGKLSKFLFGSGFFTSSHPKL